MGAYKVENQKKTELHVESYKLQLYMILLVKGSTTTVLAIAALHYTDGATWVINLIVNSTSPDSTPRSRNQTFCTNSPLTQLMLLSRTRQFSLSGTSFLIVVSPEETRKMSLILAAETNG